MGIRGLTTFLERYPIPLLESVDVCNQYVLVDCTDLLFIFAEDLAEKGLGLNYVAFRQKVISFFRGLQQCDIKPIMIYDGFIREEDDKEYYNYLDMEHPRPIIEVMNSKLQVFIIKQTAEEFNIPWFCARPQSYEDVAALSNLLQIPALSANSIFAAFNIDMPCLMLNSFLSEKPHESNGRMVIKAAQFSMRKIVQTFRVKEEYFFLLCVLFDGKTFERYKTFRNNNFKTNMMIPRHLRTAIEQRNRFWRPNAIESALLWFSRMRTPVTKIVNDVITTISDEETGERSRKEIFQKLERYKAPKMRRILLLEMIEKISDPEICKLLESGLEQAVNDESEAYLDDTVLRRMYKGNFPIWAPRFLHCQASNQPFASLRTVFPSILPKFKSEHPILIEIPKIIYQLLIRKEKGEVIVDLYDNITNDGYRKAGSILIDQSQQRDIDVYKPLEDLNEPDMEQRKDFLLNLLFSDADHRVRYKSYADNLSDDMKLTLAITNFWVIKGRPERALVKAMVAMFSFMQIRIQRQNDMAQNTSRKRLEEHKEGEDKEAEESDEEDDNEVEDEDIVSRWLLLWGDCFESVTALNQILNFPFPEPSLGKLCNFSIVWSLHDSISSGVNVCDTISADGFSELYRMMLEVVSY